MNDLTATGQSVRVVELGRTGAAATSAVPAPAISVRGLTKDYGGGRGIFEVSLDVAPGEAVGFLGPNGAGKSTTMRHLMGFIRPQAGSAEIMGHACFAERPAVQEHVGYLPGEPACPDELTVRDFLALMADMRRLRDRSRLDVLAARFDLDMRARIGSLSKGNRQKVAIVNAFMGAPDVLLLDEPTSGLDPLMQERFMELVREERSRGAAILLSSHIFEEVERACDRVVFIRDGRIVATRSMREVRGRNGCVFDVRFASAAERDRWLAGHADAQALGADEVRCPNVGDVNAFVRDLAAYDLAALRSREQTLEELFIQLYEGR